MKILHLIDSFDFNSSARQLHLLGPALANDAASVEICCLGAASPALESLRQMGVLVHALEWTRWFDPSVVWNLRAVLRESGPDLVHVWGIPALRTLAVAARECLPRVVMSDVLTARAGMSWFDRRLLDQVRCVTVAGADDRARCIHEGVLETRLRLIPPAVQQRCQDPFLEKGPDTLVLACAGQLERQFGFRQAIWAFDFVHNLYPNALLEIVGNGSQLGALQSLTEGLRRRDSVHFHVSLTDASAVLRRADVVIVPSLARCGRQTVLEAMALGRPVIASDVPYLRELIDDGETGMLVTPEDVVQLARRIRLLLQDEELRKRLGAAAQERQRTSFPLDRTIEAWREVYHSSAA